MSRIARVADRLVSLAVPQVKASAAQTYYEYWCAPFACNIAGLRNYQRRLCGESWCGAWSSIGCCPP